MKNSRRAVWALSLVLVVAPIAAFAAISGSDVYLMSVGRGPGSGGSQWFTSVWVHNPGEQTALVTVSLLERGQSNPSPEQQLIEVAAGETLSFGDILLSMFGRNQAVGALRFQADRRLVVSARIFNLPGTDPAESQGQFLGGLPASFALAAGSSTAVPGITQPADGSFRTNFGLVETAGGTATVTVTLRTGGGADIASSSFTLGPYEPLQETLSSLGGQVAVDGGTLHVEVVSGDGEVLAFASMIGNGVVSQDPSTLEMGVEAVPADGSGTITSVVAGPGLAGGGSSGDVTLEVMAGDGLAVGPAGVTIAPGGVSQEMIASDQAVLGLEVGSTVLRDVVTLEAGDGVELETDGNTITVSAGAGCSERIERPLTEPVVTIAGGPWFVGNDVLQIPADGRWRIGYRVIQEIFNNGGGGTFTGAANVALWDVAGGAPISSTIALTSVQMNVDVSGGNSVIFTEVGEAVVVANEGARIAMAARSQRTDFQVVIRPDDYQVSGLPAPAGASFMWAECLSSEDQD